MTESTSTCTLSTVSLPSLKPPPWNALKPHDYEMCDEAKINRPVEKIIVSSSCLVPLDPPAPPGVPGATSSAPASLAAFDFNILRKSSFRTCFSQPWKHHQHWTFSSLDPGWHCQRLKNLQHRMLAPPHHYHCRTHPWYRCWSSPAPEVDWQAPEGCHIEVWCSRIWTLFM